MDISSDVTARLGWLVSWACGLGRRGGGGGGGERWVGVVVLLGVVIVIFSPPPVGFLRGLVFVVEVEVVSGGDGGVLGG